jgi:hypothetical protein
VALLCGGAACQSPASLREARAGSPVPAATAPDLWLEDQTGRRWHLGATRRRTTVWIVGCAATVDRSTRWDREVVTPLAGDAGADVHRVLCLASYPRIVRGVVASRVRASADPPDVPVLLDWDDAVAGWLGCPTTATTIVVTDAAGRQALRLEGEPTAGARSRLEQALRSLPAEGLAP